MANFLNPETLRDAATQRLNASGKVSALAAIRKVHGHGPAQGDPVALAKSRKARADEDEDGDDDRDEDMLLTDTEHADLRARRKAKKDANRKRSNADAALKMIKSIHREGARAEDPDAFIKAQATRMRYRDSRPSFVAIKKAQMNPLTMEKLFGSSNGNHEIDMDAVQRIIAQGKREMRKSAGIPSAVWNAMTGPQRLAAMGKGATGTFKPTFPRNSANGEWDSRVANTGAANDWRDEGTERPGVERVGGFSDFAIPPDDPRITAAVALGSNRDAATDAIKRDWARTKMKQAREFSNRPAARVNDDQW